MSLGQKVSAVIAVSVIVLGIAAYWILSGFTLKRNDVYDLNGSGSQSAQTSWRFRAGQVLLPLLYSHDTHYAPRYDEQVFRNLTIGMRQTDVRALLGEPLRKYQLADGRSIWHYSEHGPKSQDYLVRLVEFTPEGRLTRKTAEFYVD